MIPISDDARLDFKPLHEHQRNFYIHFCAILFNKTENLHFPPNSAKIVTTLASYVCKKYINVIFLSKYITYKILYNFMQQN